MLGSCKEKKAGKLGRYEVQRDAVTAWKASQPFGLQAFQHLSLQASQLLWLPRFQAYSSR